MKRLVLTLALAAATAFISHAQTMLLNATKNDIIAAFGEPELVCPDDVGDDKCEFVFYGDDYFFFRNGMLERMSILTPVFTIQGIQAGGMKVGDKATFITHGNNSRVFKEETSNGFFRIFSCETDNGNELFQIYVRNDIIQGFLISKIIGKAKYSEDEFMEFFKEHFKPTDKRPENSLWPSGMNVNWDKACIRKSEDEVTATCCIPFTGEYAPSSNYSGNDCPQVARRLVITKILDESDRFKQSIISLVPKPGLSPGDSFSGLLVYDNVNSGTTFAWEYYEDGRLVCSRFPASKTPDLIPEITTAVRQAQKLFYMGGKEGLSDYDWAIISANRINATESFVQNPSEEWTEDKMLSEKHKYAFTASPDPDFVKAEIVESYKDNGKKAEGEKTCSQEGRENTGIRQESTDSHESSDTAADDIQLPPYVGKADNLSYVIRLKESPLDLKFDFKKSSRGGDEYVQFLTCDNSDCCDYTIKLSGGMMYRIYPGKNVFEDIKGTFHYHYHRGGVVSKIDPLFPYAMPVAPGTKVKFMKDPREKYRSFAVLAEAGEPAFAMRGGRVCKTDDDGCILVVHKDGSFAAYMNVEERCVYPGDSVNAGDPIGKCAAGKLSVSIFFLDKNKINTDVAMPYTHLTPYFKTAGGDVKLETGVEYVSFIDTDLITREMNGAQKKNYLKKKK